MTTISKRKLFANMLVASIGLGLVLLVVLVVADDNLPIGAIIAAYSAGVLSTVFGIREYFRTLKYKDT